MSGCQRPMKCGWSLSGFTMLAITVGMLSAVTTDRSLGDDKKVEKPVTAQPIYELRVYTTLEGRLPALNARFKNHTIPLFEKHGMKNVMYWIPTDPVKSQNTLIYVLEHKSMDAAKKSWADFRNDPEWKKAQQESEKDGKIVAHVESTYMTAAEYSPPLKK